MKLKNKTKKELIEMFFTAERNENSSLIKIEELEHQIKVLKVIYDNKKKEHEEANGELYMKWVKLQKQLIIDQKTILHLARVQAEMEEEK